MRFPSLALARRHLQTSYAVAASAISGADMGHSGTGFVFSRNQKMKRRYTMGCGPSSKSADPADARETSG